MISFKVSIISQRDVRSQFVCLPSVEWLGEIRFKSMVTLWSPRLETDHHPTIPSRTAKKFAPWSPLSSSHMSGHLLFVLSLSGYMTQGGLFTSLVFLLLQLVPFFMKSTFLLDPTSIDFKDSIALKGPQKVWHSFLNRVEEDFCSLHRK